MTTERIVIRAATQEISETVQKFGYNCGVRWRSDDTGFMFRHYPVRNRCIACCLRFTYHSNTKDFSAGWDDIHFYIRTGTKLVKIINANLNWSPETITKHLTTWFTKCRLLGGKI